MAMYVHTMHVRCRGKICGNQHHHRYPILTKSLPMSNCTPNHSALRTPLLRLLSRRDLTTAERAEFQFVTIDDLRNAMEAIQEDQVKKRKLQHLSRIKPFIDSMEEYGKVIEVFLNTSNVLAYVWVKYTWSVFQYRNKPY